MEGRQILATGTLEEYRRNPNFANEHAELPPKELSLYKGEAEFPYNREKWAMAIDLNKCNGCNACVVACQSENNIPVVGKDQVMRGREMHWIASTAITRRPSPRPTIPPATMSRSSIRQHFSSRCLPAVREAPCEQVCPSAPRAHSAEGLNDMTLQPVHRHALLLETIVRTKCAASTSCASRIGRLRNQAAAESGSHRAQPRRHGKVHLLCAAHNNARIESEK